MVEGGGGDTSTEPTMSGYRRREVPLGDDDWMERALCRGIKNASELFHPPIYSGMSSYIRKQMEKPGKDVCSGCGVREECLEYALSNRIHDGIWGGKNESERKTIWRRRARLRAIGDTLMGPVLEDPT